MSDYLQDRLVAAVGDHYLVEAEIGRGGMAAVYRALDLRLNRHVAIKLLPPDLAFNAEVKTRFLREAQMAAQLNHPNIVPIYSVDERDGVVFFVMALVEGMTLAQQLYETPRMSFEDVRRVVGDVGDALDYAHRKGVVHRDIKPDNIMLDGATGRPMVTDFGIARAAAGDSRLTVTGVAVGTPAYMSPEQALGERDVDGRSDIYSLGVVAYQMLTGEQPFKAANTPAMLVKHVSEVPRPVREKRPDTPEPIARAVETALAKDPAARWPSGAAFRDAIRAAAVADAPAPPRVEQLGATGYMRSPMAGATPGGPPIGAPARPGVPAFVVPPLPVGADRETWRDWRDELRDRAEEFRDHRDEWRQARRDQRQARRDTRRGGSSDLVAAGSIVDDPARSLDERVAAFRRRLAGNFATLLMLFGINMIVTPGFWWWLFPALGVGVGIVRRWGALWADGASLKQLFRRGTPAPAARSLAPSAPAPRTLYPPALPLPAAPPAEPPMASDAVLAGPHGGAVRRAVGDRIVIREVLASLTATERQMLPDVEPTVKALSDRIASLATTLHSLDADASGANLGALDQRIADLRQDPASAERDRRLALLERQRATVHDLLERRAALVPRLESAGMALHTLRLDLLKLRSAGLDSALGDVTSATQEARALSRDIGHVLDAAEEVRRL
ncbi:MAG: protein kinase [Gemmatimonadota bacterium]|nr:protein kinase [Gemmatimonadota bacterium]